MPHSTGWARGRGSLRSRRIQPPDTPSKRYAPLSPEEDAFIREKIAAGLSNVEAARMFFRKFQRDITTAVVRDRRKSVGGSP